MKIGRAYGKLKASIPKYMVLLRFYLSSGIDWVVFRLFSGKSSGNAAPPGLARILFTFDQPRVGLIRLVRALKAQYDIDIVLVIPNRFASYFENEAFFSEIHTYRNYWHFRRIMARQDGISLAHVFIRPSKIAKILIDEFKIPVIASTKDLSVCYHGPDPPRWYLRQDIPLEKYCLEQADGVIAESLEACYAYKAYGIKRKPHRIYFPEYCERDKLQQIEDKIGNELHLVYIGGVRGSQANNLEFGAIQLHWLIETLNEQKIHFHIYPNPRMNKAIYDEYFEIASEKEFFTMHQSLEPMKLNEELTRYHYGVLPFFNEDTIRSNEKRKHAGSQKLFNYIEAGIPALVSVDLQYQAWLAERYSAGIGLEKQEFFNLQERLKMVNYNKMRSEMEKNRGMLLIENNIPRLYQFYDVVKNGYWRQQGESKQA